MNCRKNYCSGACSSVPAKRSISILVADSGGKTRIFCTRRLDSARYIHCRFRNPAEAFLRW